jgi:small-conductance mechanosensitive channel
MDTQLFNTVYYGNTFRSYLVSLAIVIGGSLLMLVVRAVVRRRSKLHWADRFLPLFLLAAAYTALIRLKLSGTIEMVAYGLFTFIAVLTLVKGIIVLIDRGIARWADRQEEGSQDAELVRRYRPLKTLVHLVVWLIGSLFFLGNLGLDISAVIAGLGVSGIAVAIAAQGILGDLFNYFVILFDRPFEVGDFIIFGDKMGGVEKIGIKTTRIRAIGGEQLIIANSDLTGSKIHNYKRMERRRVVFEIGVTYQTPGNMLEEITRRIRGIIEALDNATFDRCHFKSFGDYALKYETVYYVGSADYALYMDIQQEINLRIAEAFEEMGVEFAYPTQVVYLPKDS